VLILTKTLPKRLKNNKLFFIGRTFLYKGQKMHLLILPACQHIEMERILEF